MKNRDSSGPLDTIRYGNIEASIWKNQTATGERYNVTLARVYKEGDTFKHSSSFGEDELLRAARLANDAYTWIQAVKREERTRAAEPVAVSVNGA